MRKTFQSIPLIFLAACVAKSPLPSPQTDASPSCNNLEACVNLVSKISGKKYTYTKSVENHKVGFSENTQITAENADLVLTNILLLNDLTRVPSGEANSYYIIEAKNALQSPILVFEGSLKKPAVLPKTFEIVTLKYKTQDPAMADILQRFLVDLVPRYGRISSYPDTGYLIITDSAMNIQKIVDVLSSVDRPLSVKFKKELEERRQAKLKQGQP